MSDVSDLVIAEFKGRVREDLELDIEKTPLAEMGIDSLDFFESLMTLEEKLGFEIPVDELEADMTLRSLIGLVEQAA